MVKTVTCNKVPLKFKTNVPRQISVKRRRLMVCGGAPTATSAVKIPPMPRCVELDLSSLIKRNYFNTSNY